MKTTLVQSHKDYLVKSIFDFLKSLKNQKITFDGNGCLIETTYVTRVYILNNYVHICTHNGDIENKFDDTINHDEYDDLFLTELLYKIEKEGGNTFQWQRIKNGKVIYTSDKKYDCQEIAYSEMRMIAFIQIENLTCEHKECKAEFLKDKIVVEINGKIDTEFSLIKTIE